MKTGSIEQSIYFPAQPQDVYEALMDEAKHAEFTGSEVKMSKEIHGKFSAFDGYVHGRNLELVPGKKIVQEWHFEEDGWPDDHFSRCEFNFEKEGEGTRMQFKQTDIPEHKVSSLEKGWDDFYWEPMTEFFENR